jgi:hypothetical protein
VGEYVCNSHKWKRTDSHYRSLIMITKKIKTNNPI